MALFFASFPGQGVRTGEILRGQWVLLPLAFHLARSRLCPISIWLLPVDPVVFHLCEINIDHSSESGKSVLMQYTCARVCVCVCMCVNAHPVPCFAEFYTNLQAFNVG